MSLKYYNISLYLKLKKEHFIFLAAPWPFFEFYPTWWWGGIFFTFDLILLSSRNVLLTGSNLAVERMWAHKSIILSMFYLLTFVFLPDVFVIFLVECIQVLCVNEINKSVAHVALVLNYVFVTFGSQGRYRKS